MTRAGCLFVLILVHCFSFSTSAANISLIDNRYSFLLIVLTGFNAAFLVLSGISFRLLLEPYIVGNQIKKQGFWKVADPLCFLVLVEGLKNVILSGSWQYFWAWDFLKTLLFGFSVCYALGRLNIYLLPLLSAFIGWFFLDLRNLLSIFLWSPVQGVPDGLSLSPLVLRDFLFILVLVGLVTYRFILKPKMTIFKVIAGLSIAILLSFEIASLPLAVGLSQYRNDYNQWVYNLIGDPQGLTLMPFFVWAPSVFSGFGLAHWVFKNKTFFVKVNKLGLIFISGCLWFFLLYFNVFRNLDWILFSSGNMTWNSFFESFTTFSGELNKVTNALVLFSVFWWIRSGFSLPKIFSWSKKLAAASFWIYFVATAWAQVSASFIFSNTGSFAASFIFSSATSLCLGILLAQFVYWVSSKKLTLVVRSS